MAEDCIFCSIASGEQEADVVHQDDNLIVFKDINPKAPVHLLVVPKKHIVSIKEIEEDDRDLVATLIYTARDIAAEQNLAGYKLFFNVGRQGGQLVDHLHLHLLGGWKDSDAPDEGDV